MISQLIEDWEVMFHDVNLCTIKQKGLKSFCLIMRCRRWSRCSCSSTLAKKALKRGMQVLSNPRGRFRNHPKGCPNAMPLAFLAGYFPYKMFGASKVSHAYRGCSMYRRTPRKSAPDQNVVIATGHKSWGPKRRSLFERVFCGCGWRLRQRREVLQNTQAMELDSGWRC